MQFPHFHALPARARQAAFTLIEITLALGVVTVAMVGMVGMLPVGMQVFRKAMDLTLETQMVQHVVGEANQLAFTDLPKLESRQFYFDDSGNLVGKESSARQYAAKIQVNSSSAMPGAATGNASLAMLTITFLRADTSAASSPYGKFVTYVADRGGATP